MLGALPQLPEGYYWKIKNPGTTFESLHCMRRGKLMSDKSIHGFYVDIALDYGTWDQELELVKVLVEGGAE